MIKYLSLFSGIGAFEKALKNLSIPFDLVGYSEIDKYASKSYAAIHDVPETMNFGDITKIDETKLGEVDFITYGFPCQDISISGKKKGLFNEDGSRTRSGLFFDALRIINETQPKVAIAENVKNLTGEKFKEQFEIVLNSLSEAGYNNYWKVLNAIDFGIPQQRERVFIVSIRKDLDSGVFEFPEGYPLEKCIKDLLDEVVEDRFYLNKTLNMRITPKYIQYDNSGKNYNSQACRLYFQDGVCPTLPHNNGGDKSQVALINKADCDLNKSFLKRRMTAKECFRFQGFTDEDYFKTYNKGMANIHLYRQAGNSIVVDVAEELLCMLFDEDGNFFI